MSGEPSIPTPRISTASTSSLWDRITDFASRNQKTIIYTTAGLSILVTAGGYYYYSQRHAQDDSEGKRKREKSVRKKKQKNTNDEESLTNGMPPGPVDSGEKRTTVDEDPESQPLPEVTEESVQSLSAEVSL
jgi:mitochondrial import receptor subunit TOM70